jgi:hypothetical protein
MPDLRSGTYADTTEIARQFQLNDAHVRRILRFGYLAPSTAHRRASEKAGARRDPAGVVETFGGQSLILFILCRQLVKLG